MSSSHHHCHCCWAYTHSHTVPATTTNIATISITAINQVLTSKKIRWPLNVVSLLILWFITLTVTNAQICSKYLVRGIESVCYCAGSAASLRVITVQKVPSSCLVTISSVLNLWSTQEILLHGSSKLPSQRRCERIMHLHCWNAWHPCQLLCHVLLKLPHALLWPQWNLTHRETTAYNKFCCV